MAQPEACSSFLEQGRKTKRSEVGEGKEERESRESRYRETAGGDWAGLKAAE